MTYLQLRAFIRGCFARVQSTTVIARVSLLILWIDCMKREPNSRILLEPALLLLFSRGEGVCLSGGRVFVRDSCYRCVPVPLWAPWRSLITPSMHSECEWSLLQLAGFKESPSHLKALIIDTLEGFVSFWVSLKIFLIHSYFRVMTDNWCNEQYCKSYIILIIVIFNTFLYDWCFNLV